MNFFSIASGSSGNCIFVGDDSTKVLIDAGISGKRIENGLKAYDLSAEDITAILISHEHLDHISGLGVLARRYGIPIFASEGTIEGIKKCKSVGDIPDELFNEIKTDHKFSVGEFDIYPIRISHDAAEPTAYRISNGITDIAVATDLGYFDDYIVKKLTGLDAILIEANHDIRMLEAGSYPYELKQRILGKKGHLSNENCGRLLCKILHPGLKKIFLGHLSKDNNIPELAYETVRVEIDLSDIPYKSMDFDISIASRTDISELIKL